MKGLIFLALLALAGVVYLVMQDDSRPVAAPAPVQADEKITAPPPPPEPVKVRTIEDIRADVARKTVENVRPVSTVAPIDPQAARNARRAEFQSKIDAKRAELVGLDARIAAKSTEVAFFAGQIAARQRVTGTANRQWRYVIGGKVDDGNTTWQDISTLPPVAARNGRTVRYRDAPSRRPTPDADLARMAGRLTTMKNELETLRTQRMVLESAIGNLGLQMNMAQ